MSSHDLFLFLHVYFFVQKIVFYMLLCAVNISFCPVILPLNIQGRTCVSETLCAHTVYSHEMGLETSIIYSQFPISFEGRKARQCCTYGKEGRGKP